jgi:O-antigen/teichoic acid export membrane protein
VFWTIGSLAGNQAVNFVIQILFLRLLSPTEFGLIAMAAVFTGFAGMIADLGLGAALVQKADATEEHYSAVFWFALALGFALFVVFAVTAPFVATFYHEPRLTLLTMALALHFPIGAFTAIHYTLLQKRLQFRILGIIGMTANLLSSVTALLAASYGLGVWSLIIQQLASALISTVFLLISCPWRPKTPFNKHALQDVMRFSLSVFAFNIFNYSIRNAGNLILGRSLGAVAVGLYNRAYSIMLLPLSFVSYRVGEVIFPAFCLIQESPDRIARIYLRTIRVIALVTFPLMIGLWSVSDRFVQTVLGGQWLDIIPLLKVGCFVGMVESIGGMNGPIYLACGKANLRLKVVLIIAPLSVLAMVIGLKWGVHGVMYGYGIYSLLITYPSILIPVSLVGLTLWDVTKALLGILAAACAMGAAVRLATLFMPPGASWFWLGAQVAFGAIIYLAIVSACRVEAFRELIALLKERLNQRRTLTVGA